jgi:hypothetical protein
MLCMRQAMTKTTARQLTMQSTLPSPPLRRLGNPVFVCERSPELFALVHGRRCTLTVLAPGVVRLLSFGDSTVFGTIQKNTWSNTSLQLAPIRTVWSKATRVISFGVATGALWVAWIASCVITSPNP